jgi:hypothetical protein
MPAYYALRPKSKWWLIPVLLFCLYMILNIQMTGGMRQWLGI